ncbi:MAG: D-cysteine desulfhydrase, partial [Kiloniellales bacterium]
MDDLDRFPRVALAHLPTPLEPLERLSGHLGGPRILIKRDDCTGLALGGNKTRKLEFLMAAALDKGADTVITSGGLQSNHVRQTAAAAAKLGLEAELVLIRNVPWEGADYAEGGNVLLDRLLGARLHILPGETDRTKAMEELAGRLKAGGRRPYVIPVGGSNEVGALGYVACARELAAQAEALCGGFDALVLASSSGGTQAGLVAGLAALGHPARVIGIDVDADPGGIRETVAEIAGATLARLEPRTGLPEAAVIVEGGYSGAAYGLPTEAMTEAVALLGRLEGIFLDPVYSGKAMAGLIGLIGAGRFRPGERVVFLHSGG